MQVRGFRWLEAATTGLVGVVVVAFGLELLRAAPAPGEVARGLLVPQFSGNGSALLAASIVGATVMPHVIYLHSALTGNRVVGSHPAARRKIFRFEVIDVGLAMGVAGVINLAMLATAAAVFHARGLTSASGDLGSIAAGLDLYLGAHAVGAAHQGGLRPAAVAGFARRAVTMLPALALIAFGFSPTRALVLSQVFLSFGIAFALIPLIWFTRSRRIMGLLANRRATNWLAYLVGALIIALNVYLLAQG